LGLVSCATVKVKPDPAGLTREGIASAERLDELVNNPIDALDAMATEAEILLRNALKIDAHGQSVDASVFYLKTAVDARQLLVSKASELDSETKDALLTLHNAALGRFAEHWTTDPRRRASASYRFVYGDEVYEAVESEKSDFAQLLFDRAVAAESLVGKGMIEKSRPGYGAPLVAIRNQTPERAEELAFFPNRGMHVNTTLVIDSVSEIVDEEGSRSLVTLSARNPMLSETIEIGGVQVPLSANFSASIELLLTGHNGRLWGLGGFFKADKRAAQSGIRLLEPYDPDRIPVVLTHGLASVPIIWKDLIPELIAEPDIAKNFQFMAFSYPSAYSVTESSLLFRNELAALREKYDPDGNDPLSTNLVGIGHSMGGVLTHVLVADFGDRLWNEISDRPFDSFDWEAEKRESARRLVFFDPDPGLSRAIYMSTPHGGASMAQASLAVWISRLASLPREVLASTGMFFEDPEVFSSLRVKYTKNVTSVQSLSPDSPVVKALAASPYKEGVIYHSIIGDRGKGDTPNSSDGAVEYLSSHQPGAASELIVPTPHASYNHPDTIAEVKRILRLHIAK
jgi:pimeloyl-ACP methyl ester carboxylesterase